MVGSGIGLFCDDIREEATGVVTLVGIYSDNVEVQQFPGRFPKLGIYARVIFPTDCPTQQPKIFMRPSPDGKEEVELFSWDADRFEKEREASRNLGSPIFGFIARAIVSPLALERPTRFQVVLRDSDGEAPIGTLNVQLKSKSLPQLSSQTLSSATS